eukprot:UN05940
MRAIRYVSDVIEDAPYTVTKEFMLEHKIDFVAGLITGTDSEYDAAYKVPLDQKKFLNIGRTEGISTTDILNRIRKRIKDGTL